MEQYITGDGLIRAVLVLLALSWAFHQVYTAIADTHKIKEKAEEPLNVIRAEIKGLQKELSTERERISALERVGDAHEHELADLHAGQTELCRGVQALLEHALHNGNNDEMSAASASIGKWLRNR